MNTSLLSYLTWDQLTSKEFIGKLIVIYTYEDRPPKKRYAKIVGTDFVNGMECLLVRNTEDIFIILPDGKGRLWEAYDELD